MAEGSPTAAACGDIASVLCRHPTLTALDVSDNELGDCGVRCLCEGLKHPGCKVQKLQINDCTLTGACLGALSAVLSTQQSLTELELSDNIFDDSGVRQLCEGLKSPGCRVQKLGMFNCSLTSPCWVELSSLLSTSTSLTELDLGDNGMGDPGMKQLCEGLKHPGCKIQKLEMTHSSLTGSCCEDLTSVLCTNMSLVELDLSSNELGDSGMRQLCEGLRHPACKIHKLRVINCSLTGSCCEHLALALSKNQCLTELNLGSNELGDSGMKQLCDGLKSPGCKLRTLVMTSGSLTASSCADLASVLSTNQSLKELILSGNTLLDSGVRQLCERLKHPDCKIQKLWLDSCSLTAACCADISSALSTNPSLTELHLADNKLGDCGAREIFGELKHPDCKIQRLWMWNCSLTESCCADLASVLGVNQSLTELELCGNELGDAGVRLLCEGLKHPGCKMQKLGLGSCSLRDSCCADLTSVLSVNQSLTELELSDNVLGDSGVRHLCKGLKHTNCKIPRLRLWSCSLTGSCCADLSSVLTSNQSLMELVLSYNELGDSGVRQLCEGLRHPGCKLQNLELWHCSLTGSCCDELSSLLCVSEPPSEVDAGDDEQEDTGVSQRCDGLKQLSSKMQKPE